MHLRVALPTNANIKALKLTS